ncbi:MAG: AAA family ATPase [Candidatus Woesearchaeota archaeon]
MLWYKELGFNNNPFSIKPAAFHNMVIGYDLNEIYDKISKSKVLFVEGRYGYGKTTILKHLIRHFGGRRQVAYYNCNRAETTIETRKILAGKYGIIGRMLNLLPEDMIFLLDEVEKLSKTDQTELLEYYNQGKIKSVVFFGPSFEKVGFGVEFRKLLVDNVIELTKLTDAEAVDMVRRRIGDLKLLSDKIIKEVFKNSEYNPRQMLENLEDLCKYALENNDDEITEQHLKKVLKIQKPARKKKPLPPPELKVEEVKQPDQPIPKDEEVEYFFY